MLPHSQDVTGSPLFPSQNAWVKVSWQMPIQPGVTGGSEILARVGRGAHLLSQAA